MLDSGRRFWPVPLLKDVMQTMSFVKLNVLHLHAVDFCRFGIESKLPVTGEKLLGDCGVNATGRCLKAGHEFEGYYLQTEITELVAYAKDLGIRVIPEIEQPEHACEYLSPPPFRTGCIPARPCRSTACCH
jgi:hexosaminidase